MGVLDNSKPTFFNFLNSAVREDTLFFTVREQALDCTVRETYLLSAVWEMLLNLIVLKLKYLQAVWERRLRRLGLGEEVHNFAARERLLDILVLKEDDLVSVRPYLALDSVREDYLLLAALIELLPFAFLADDLVDYDKILVCFV